ncbi:hypothetical protein KUCAC02_029411 [Chaenocephalus aceratus]|nr:hypothetical protein KUCAC02_029411 [Chaenocephalus aceratus]
MEEGRRELRGAADYRVSFCTGGVEPGASPQESAASYSTSTEKDFFASDEMEGDTASLSSETEVIDYLKSGQSWQS